MSEQEELCDCGKPATWFYMPGDAAKCDTHVPRGCGCTAGHVDERGRRVPCCEWWEKPFTPAAGGGQPCSVRKAEALP